MKKSYFGSSKIGTRLFAIFAVLLMLLVSLHAGIGDVWAEPSANSDVPITTDVSPGGVESYNTGPFIQYSDAALSQPRSYLENRSGQLIYWTPYGHYVIDPKSPEKLSFFALSCSLLVNETYFTLKSGKELLSTAEGIVKFASDDRLEVEYTLLSLTSAKAGRMLVSYDFSGGKAPKATAAALDLNVDIADWCISWVVTPNADTKVTSPDVGGGLIALKEMAGQQLKLPTASMRLTMGADLLTADWTDAKEGSASVEMMVQGDRGLTPALRIDFPAGQKVVDPTLVSSSTQADPTGVNCQRKTFFYAGYYWLFYLNSTAICYRSSADGRVWSAEMTMPESTTPASGTGFDVASRNGYVVIGWMDTSVWIKKGVIQGSKIVWSARAEICPYVPAQRQCVAYAYPISVAIGTDCSFWIHYVYHGNDLAGWEADVEAVSRSPSGDPGTFSTEAYWWGVNGPNTSRSHWYTLLPTDNGYMALLETSYAVNSTDNQKVAVRYYTGIQNWTSYLQYDIGMDYSSKSQNFSAVSSLNGTVHIAYKAASGGYVKYARIFPYASAAATVNLDTALGMPTIALDANHVLHAHYVVEGSPQQVYHREKPEFTGSWSAVGSSALIFSASAAGARIRGLTAAAYPLEDSCLAWAERSASTGVKFASMPLPFGTAGAPSQPWNRDGLSPYGTYFNMNSDYVSPGSGLLTVTSNDVSIPGRAGVDLGISRVYQQPRYCWNSDQSPYRYATFPFLSLGQYWSLDLPWMDQYYVYLANGQRIMISWGNEGDQKEFVNRQDTPFTLRDVTKGTSFYELITSSGLRYKFESASPYKLVMISDLKNYNPLSASETVPYNSLNFTYSGNVLQSITDSALGRSITFSSTGGLLNRITRPDGKFIDFTYTTFNTKPYLTKVTDPDTRYTDYSYNSSASYCLDSITYPTKGKVSFCYAADSSPSTEVKTWLVTKESLKNSTSGALIRQTNFDYKVVNGNVVFSKLTSYNETATLQGSNEYIFRSSMGSYTETVKDVAGVQMQSKVTWYDASGRPARQDTYAGDSAVVNATEYMAYDDWGNLIFTRNALGQCTYTSYANTSTQNSFQGGDVLERSYSGKVFYDALDDWEFSDWTTSTAGVAALDATSDPPRAPALKLTRSVSAGNCYIRHSYSAASSSYYIQFSYLATTAERSSMQGLSGTTARIDLSSYNGNFQYCYNSAYTTVGACAAGTWYDVGFCVYSNSTYDIYIDGALVKKWAPMNGVSGTIGQLNFQAGYSGSQLTSILVDNVRIYSSLTITFSGLGSNYLLELIDGNGALLGRTRSSTMYISALPLNAPPAMIRLTRVGNETFSTPMTDIWGGDNYDLKKGYYSSGLVKTGIGFGLASGSINDDAKPAGSTEVYSVNNGQNDLAWAQDAAFAVSGSSFHVSQYVPSWWDDMSHWHGFNGSSSGMSVASTDVLLQYIYLQDGKVPLEISLQYYAQGAWRRAYWGGSGAGADILNVPSTYTPTAANRHYMGPVPSATGQWIQLAVNASVLGITGSQSVTGIIYGLYSGTALWDYSSKAVSGITVSGLSSGMVVKMVMDNGTVFSKTSTGSSLKLYPYSRGINAFPISATFSVYDSGGALLYTSQHFSEINSGDTFAYSASSFYPNAIKYGMHSKCVGTFAYQDDLGKVPTATYLRYDVEGNQVETRSLLGASWTYTQAAFDIYGNMISSTDATGRTTCTEYSSASKYTYPTSSWVEGKRENLDWDTSWSLTRSVPAGDTSWLQSTYTTARSYSPSRSIKESLSGASQNGLDYGTVTYYKDLYANEVSKISVRMYVESYSHNNNASDAMDSGIRLRLYDAAGANYANYTYWLACWSGSQDNRTSADPYVSVVCGKPTLNTWLLRDLYPMSKWNVDTSRCDKIRIEAYTNCLNAYGDQFIVYYDDITYADSAEEVGDSFDSGLGWGTSLSSSNGVTSWLSGGYSAAQSVSSPNSMRAGFSNGPVGYDTGTTTNYRAYEADIVTKVSLRMYVQSYSHDGSAWDTMDAGLKMRLYNAAGTNYATYTYWLACWYQAANNKTAPDQTVKVIYGRPATGQWLNLNLEPNKDFSISWNGCVKVRFELYSYGSGTSGDTFLAYFDDFNIKGQDAPRTSYTWDTKNGRQLSVTDPLGHVTSQWYDALGRVIRSNVTVDNDKFTANIYDDEANKNTITNELGQKVVTYYDTVGRAVKVQRTGYGSTAYSTVTTSYTWQDKPARTYDAAGRVTKYSYDYLGRVTLVLNNDGTSSSVSYDDRNMKVTATDENGHKTVSVKDKLGRLNATREYSTATAFNSTIVSYDAAGNVKAVRAANNEVTRMSYDSLGRQTSITYPDGYAESTTYDAAGNVFNATARDGAVTRTYYDATGRAIRVASASETISSVYDAEGNLVRTSSALGFITYQYDNQHRVVGEVERINSTSYGIGFTYNADGSISSALYPDGRTISYLYDQYGRNVDIKYGTNRLLNITYNKDDTVATKNYYNSSIATTYTYNSRGFVASIVSKNSQQANQMALTYTYDSEGNVRTIVDGMRSVTETYYYDHADRLIYAAGNWNGTLTLTYTYDVMGNRLTKNEGSAITYSYNSYNQLHTEGVWHYDHDRSGNVIWKNSTGERWKFVYNSFGQMTQVLKQTYSGGVWSPLTTVARYYYDAAGARARTVENGVSTSYVYAGHDPMLQISADGKSNKYLYCNGRLEVRQIDGTEGYVYIADALGSTRRVFRNGDTTQTTFAALSYMPFGKALMSVSSDRVRFADEIQDSTNLVYLFARYYDPELGRFYALDPVHGKLSMPQTLDRYVYCGDNPLSRTDPTGRFWGLQILVGAVVGAALGAVVAIASGGDINEIAKGAVAGAIGGAVFGATMGLCTMAVAPGVIASAAPLIAGGVSSGTESFVGEFLKTGDVGQSIKAAAVGTAVGVLSAGSSHLLFKGGIGKKISDAVGDRVTSIAERRTERIIDSSAIAEKQTVVSQMLPSHARMIGQGGRDFVETLPLSVQSSYAVNKGVEWLSPQES